jgi:hypothetical protein
MDNVTLTEKQISEMKHAIGLLPWYVENGVFKPYRNYFEASGTLDSWECLVQEGIAVKNKNFIGIYYSLTEKGCSLLSDIVEIKIDSKQYAS